MNDQAGNISSTHYAFFEMNKSTGQFTKLTGGLSEKSEKLIYSIGQEMTSSWRLFILAKGLDNTIYARNVRDNYSGFGYHGMVTTAENSIVDNVRLDSSCTGISENKLFGYVLISKGANVLLYGYMND